MESVTLKQIGYRFSGTAVLNSWGGGQGTIDMQAWVVKGKFDRKKMIAGINDSQFGCESIESAEVFVEKLFENGYTEHDTMIEVENQELKSGD